MEQKYKIVTSHSAEGLSIQVDELVTKGWTPVGSHHVVILHEDLTYSGQQHRRTIYEREYTQTMVKEGEYQTMTSEILGNLSDQQLFGKSTHPKENVLYKLEYFYGNERKIGIGHWVAHTDTFYILCEKEGVGFEKSNKVNILSALGNI